MSDFIDLAKHLPHGFEPLANDVLDTCQVIFYIEAGLGNPARNDEPLPLDVVASLEKKFRAAQTDVQALQQVVAKLLNYERAGAMGRMKRGIGKMFGDNGLDRMGKILTKTREDLKVSALMFQWKCGADRMESELGLGCIGLTAALEKSGCLRRRGASLTSEDNHSVVSSALQHQRARDNHTPSAQTPQSPMLSHLPMSSKRPDYAHDAVSIGSSIHSPVLDNYFASSTRNTPLSDYGSNHGPHLKRITAMPNRPGTFAENDDSSSALAAIVDDVKALELQSPKKIQVNIEPFKMPRQRPRSNADADKPSIKQALVSAVRAQEHNLITQLLDRGCSPNTGPEAHALNEAILGYDAESIRLLLLFGADPNAADKNGACPLVAAVSKLYVDAAIALLKYGADPNVGPGLDSPLYLAAAANNIKLTHLMLMYGANANETAANGNTVLIGSINKTTPKTLIDMLLNYGACPNEKNRAGKTALFEAISNGRVDIVESLVAHGADPNLPGPKHMLWVAIHHTSCLEVLLANNAHTKKCPGLLELAVSINSIEAVRILLKAGVDANVRKDGLYTPLCSAIRDNRKDIMELLLRSGADPNLPAAEYPCFKCVTHQREHFLPALVDAGANLSSPKGILETAVTSKNLPALKWLLEQGVDVNERGAKGDTPLTSAIRSNDVGLVDTLLAYGANPNLRGQDWPICMAVQNPEILVRILAALREPRAFKGVMETAVVANQLESVKLLLAAGVSVEDRNGGVFSPLTSAIREHRVEIFKFLINEARADVNAPGEHLPIVKALRRCATEHTSIIDMLLDKGADPNAMYRGWNGIMQALENGDADMLKKLAERSGVDLKAKNEFGQTVTEIAVSRGWDEAVDILLANGRT
ncbi:hypothetical protein UVI_02029600 [Ustilaginoidea virens]|nr:hypothetical protein UVI_02029600 [Ustilaginoidea virens]